MAVLPDFAAAEFVPGTVIDNRYFPLIENRVLSYRAEETDPDTGEVTVERNDLFTTSETHVVHGVETTVVHDTVYADEVILEDTLDFYAQDTRGNVWYFGEIVINYEYDDDGNFVGTNDDGAWISDGPGNAPGMQTPGSPAFGPAWYLEFAPGIALDESIVIGLDETVDIGFGHFENVLKIVDSSSLHPDGVEFKYYAPGVGEISEQSIESDGRVGGSSDLYRRGEVGRPDADDADDTTLALADLHEGRAVVNPAEVRDLDAAAFAGDGTPMQVTFVRGTTETTDALGAYLYDTATGEIGPARILVPDLGAAGAGDTIAVDVPEGMTLGLFLVARADAIGVDLAAYVAGGLQVTNILTGAAANVADGIAPMVTDVSGSILPIQPLGALGGDDGTNYLNPAAGLQALGLASAALAGQDAVLLGFEDSLATSTEHDGDYNDAIVAVSRAPLSAATLALLAREARGVRLGTASGDTIPGTAHADRIKGLAGDDAIDGRAGADRLAGGAGDDSLDGGRGHDRLRGGVGDDALTGGTGPDVFLFTGAGFGADTIRDFTRSDGDVVELHGNAGGIADFDSNRDGRLTGADDAVTRANGTLTIDFGGGDRIAFDGVASLHAADFLFA